MPYGDTSVLPTTAAWPEPPRRRAAGFLPLALATVLSFAAGVGSTVLYLQVGQDHFRVAEVPLIEAERSPTRVRPDGLNGSAAPVVVAAPDMPRPSTVSSAANLPSPISSAMAMTPPVPAIDLAAQGIPTAPDIVPPARAEIVVLPPKEAAPAPIIAVAASPTKMAPEIAVPAGPETRLQVASLRTREKAVEEMNRFKRVYGALLADMELEVQRLDLGERGIFHRVLSTPVGERAEGVALCAALAERRAQCQVVTLRSRAEPVTRLAVAPPQPATPSPPSAPVVAAQPAEVAPLSALVAAEPSHAEVRAQLATLRTLEGATRELNRLAKLYGGVLERTELSVSRIDQGERGVFFRILTGPLPSRDAAGEFCQRLGAGHHAGCVLIPQRPTV